MVYVELAPHLSEMLILTHSANLTLAPVTVPN